jgi:hypothetical protein
MSIFTVSINDPSLDKKSAECEFVKNAIAIAMNEFGRGNGTVTSGNVVGMSSTGASNASLGSWTYTPSASNP